MIEGFAGRQGGADALATALAGATLDAAVAEAALRIAARLGQGSDSKLVLALNRSGGLVASRERNTWPLAERVAIVAAVARRGDPARGEAIFRRASLQCLNCHAIAGAGGRVGPGLESLGASAPVDYLVDSLVEPNKAVKEGYHASVVGTSDGRVVTGIKVGQTDSALILRAADDREISIPLDRIDEQKDAGSIMPAGLVDGLTRRELVDLVRFLSELGKLGPYAVSPQIRLARRWEVASGEAVLPSVDAAVVASQVAWSPVYSTVAGVLPAADLPTVALATASGRFCLLRTELETSTPGPTRLLITPRPASVWLDGRPIALGAGAEVNLEVDLNSGAHTVALAYPPGPSHPIRLEIRDIAGSPAQARPSLGK